MMTKSISRRRRAAAALAAAAAMLSACGGGGAAPPSQPEPPAGSGPPPVSTPPATPPATPSTPVPSAPSTATVTTPNRTFNPSTVTIAANGTVTWQISDERHNITFVGAAPPGGNTGDIEAGKSVSRTFPTPGTYQYECLRHRDKGMRGTVVVQAPPAPSPPSTPPSGSGATVTTPSATFNPSNVTIPVGGSVTWQFSEARHNVTFQGAAPSGGNIPDQTPGASVARTFTAAGTYDYVCTNHSGMTGRVTVQ